MYTTNTMRDNWMAMTILELASRSNYVSSLGDKRTEISRMTEIKERKHKYIDPFFSIKLADLLYIEAKSNYLEFVYLKDGSQANKLVRATMKNVELMLKNCDFIVRCHRGFFVNTNNIVKLKGNSHGISLSMKGINAKIPVSRSYIESIKSSIVVR